MNFKVRYFGLLQKPFWINVYLKTYYQNWEFEENTCTKKYLRKHSDRFS